MAGINVGRWLGGGLVAGVVIWILEGLASFIYLADMEATLEQHGLSMEMSTSVMALSVVVSLIVGLTTVFIYAAARPRFGPGPRTAVIAALTIWIGGYVVSLLGYLVIGLFPAGMLALWGIVGLVELLLAALVGGWIYREA